jgi:hypothetical protein
VSSHQTVSYAVLMTTKGTPGRMVRIDDATWAEYGELCAAEGTSRADDMRRHVHSRVTAHRQKLAKQAAIQRRIDALDADARAAENIANRDS